jgi:hypothetical protein
LDPKEWKSFASHLKNWAAISMHLELTSQDLKNLRCFLDKNMTGKVDIYEFRDFTHNLGLKGALLEWKANLTKTITLVEGIQYQGSRIGDVPHGYGIMNSVDGDWYSGKWKYGFFHGKGTYMWPSGDLYNGKWKNGLMHGTGTYIFTSKNEKYEGNWKNDKRHGKGIFYSEVN